LWRIHLKRYLDAFRFRSTRPAGRLQFPVRWATVARCQEVSFCPESGASSVPSRLRITYSTVDRAGIQRFNDAAHTNGDWCFTIRSSHPGDRPDDGHTLPMAREPPAHMMRGWLGSSDPCGSPQAKDNAFPATERCPTPPPTLPLVLLPSSKPTRTIRCSSGPLRLSGLLLDSFHIARPARKHKKQAERTPVNHNRHTYGAG